MTSLRSTFVVALQHVVFDPGIVQRNNLKEPSECRIVAHLGGKLGRK